MPDKRDAQKVPWQTAGDFLRRTLPFSDLDQESVNRLAMDVSEEYFPKGSLVLIQGSTEVRHLYLIRKGGVRAYIKDQDGSESLVDFRGEGSAVGALALIRGSRANLNVETLEDTLFYRLPRQAFLDLLEREPGIAGYYLKLLSEGYVSKAFEEIRRQKLAPRQDSGLSLFSTRVGGVLARPAVTIGVGASLRRAAELMVREKVGSLLILGQDGRLAGIVTDTDFRRKVVAMGRNADEPVSGIMSSPVLSIGSEATCFDALLTMMRRQIHHLAVKGPSGTEGMVTSHDIMVLQGSSPYSLFREIAAEGSYQGLYALSARIPLAVRSLMEQGAKADNITRLMAALNDLVLERLLRLMQRELGPPPAPFCWLLMGSEGRREQTFRTDQDNALVYRDAEDPGVREYFLRFGEQAIEHLVACGFPRCKGDIMASNPKWCQPWSVWREYFDSWISQPEPSEVMHSTIFFDFRPGFGDADLAETLKAGVLKRTAREDVFLRHLAADCLKTRPPLSFFRGFIVEKDGEHKNTLDIKTRGLVPFVDFARLMCLKHGLAETNTLARYRLLEQAGRISGELCREIKDAYEFLMQIRLAHQLRQMEDGLAPDNRVDPARLTELEKRTLKDAFSVMVKVQAFIKDSFRLNV